eukprot:7116644-Lingulodinium_polyedra.AAC.1
MLSSAPLTRQPGRKRKGPPSYVEHWAIDVLVCPSTFCLIRNPFLGEARGNAEPAAVIAK